MTIKLITKRNRRIPLIALISIYCGAVVAPVLAQEQAQTKAKGQYQVSSLPTLGGTNSAGNSINDQSWVAGYSRLTGNQVRHATLWRNGSTAEDLGTLAGPNSS